MRRGEEGGEGIERKCCGAPTCRLRKQVRGIEEGLRVVEQRETEGREGGL